MVRIAPVRLAFNPKTLWFDARDLEIKLDDAVVVNTARGLEYGHLAQQVFEMPYEETKKLKSPLKAVKRLATEEDDAKFEELAAKSREALPVFKQMAAESVQEMNPVAVEYLFEGDKAVFYFESEERVDFRDLVRKLAAQFHVRVDMKQIGVRDEARMVGGLGHCGQELCCRRLGGEFNPVSIRMAKEQDLSLNPQKISGTCGRLMCCLRYEYDAYKDFHTRAPKKNAKIKTPEGEGKVVDLDVPREVVSIQVGIEKPVKVPLADMEPAEEGARPNAVGDEAWERATAPVAAASIDAIGLFSVELSGEDKLAEPGKVRHVHGDSEKSSGSGRSRRRSRGGSGSSSGNGSGSGSSPQGKDAAETSGRKPRRRRSTTVKSDGTSEVTQAPQEKAGKQEGGQSRSKQAEGAAEKQQSSQRRRSRRGGQNRSKQAEGAQAAPQEKQQGQSQVGRNSSALRAHRAQAEQQAPAAEGQQGAAKSSNRRRRRRSHKSDSGGAANAGTQQGSQTE